MKIFISWSGDRSNRIAEVLKKWIRNVIQSVEPFVSSEDISKGARWSTNIAEELQNTNFGILCVTKDNYQQPWLLFEAGALSKTLEKTFVVPLLFDLEPSDLSNSPLLQFQAASFSKDEIKKLIETINNANKNKLESNELDEAFDLWYPQLEKVLYEIPEIINDKEEISNNISGKSSQILEEVLALSRENQKLLRNLENHDIKELTSIIKSIDHSANRGYKKRHRFHPMEVERLFHYSDRAMDCNTLLLVTLSFFKDEYPWLYDVSKDLLNTLKSKKSKETKENAIKYFMRIIEQTVYLYRKTENYDDVETLHELQRNLVRFFEKKSFIITIY